MSWKELAVVKVDVAGMWDKQYAMATGQAMGKVERVPETEPLRVNETKTKMN